jgi:hypothetical protein
LIKNIIAIYPGRFQPFSKHHSNAFKWLKSGEWLDKQKYNQDSYIATTDKVELPNSPLNFSEKKMIIDKYKFGSDPNLTQVKNTYSAEEITSKYDPENTAVVYMVGEKDSTRFTNKPKKDGSAGYFKPYKGNEDNLEGYNKHGYIIVAPHVNIDIPGIGEMSGTNVRKALSADVSEDEYKKLIISVFGWYDPEIAKMLKEKFTNSAKVMKESKIIIETLLKKLINEGGNVFKDASGGSETQRINKADVIPTVKWLEKITGLSLEDNLLGTTGKKDTSGDMDIAVDVSKISKEELVKILEKAGYDKSSIKKTGDSVHFKTPINGNENSGYVQTDFMFGDPEWMKFSMAGGAQDSQFKGMHRHLFLSSIAKAQDMKWSYKNGLMNRETGEVITKDPNKIAAILLGKGKTRDDMASVESVNSAIKGRSDYENLIAQAKEDFSREGLELPKSLNESILQESAEARIQHPEDTIFWDGSKGALNSLAILAGLGKDTKDITIKWDGSPAVIFGRDENGNFILTDKGGFSAKGYDGKAKSGKDLEKMFLDRLKGREDVNGQYAKFAKSMGNIFDIFEKSVPKTVKGYFKGDLLYQSTPELINGNYVFKPNITTYTVSDSSELGNKIGKSKTGVVIHRFMDYDGNETSIKDIEQYGFSDKDGLLVVPPTSITTPPKINTSAVKSAMSDIKSKASAINSTLDKSTLSAKKISDLPNLMYKYNNSKVGNTSNLGQDFAQFVEKESLSVPKKANLLSYIEQNKDAIVDIFSAVSNIMDIKNDIVKQLDAQDSGVKANIGDIDGGEGYVVSNPKGTVKLVNRAGFTAANRAIKR